MDPYLIDSWFVVPLYASSFLIPSVGLYFLILKNPSSENFTGQLFIRHESESRAQRWSRLSTIPISFLSYPSFRRRFQCEKWYCSHIRITSQGGKQPLFWCTKKKPGMISEWYWHIFHQSTLRLFNDGNLSQLPGKSVVLQGTLQVQVDH